MELYVHDRTFARLAVIDGYKSLQWVTRWDEPGDFQLVVGYDLRDLFPILTIGNYLTRKGSLEVMVIEEYQIETDENGFATITYSGRDGVGILDKRVVASVLAYTEKAHSYILTDIYNKQFGTSASAKRQLSQLAYVNGSTLLNGVANAQYLGENVLDVFQATVKSRNVGLVSYLEGNRIVVMTLDPTDYSYAQEANPWRVYSYDYDNLVSFKQVKNSTRIRKDAVVAGEGEGSDRMVYISENQSGMARTEIYVDASSISKTVDDTVLSDATYRSMLQEKGNEELADQDIEEVFECELPPQEDDLACGDIVEVVDVTGVSVRCIVKEIILSVDEGGVTVIPGFVKYEEVTT